MIGQFFESQLVLLSGDTFLEGDSMTGMKPCSVVCFINTVGDGATRAFPLFNELL